VQRRARPLGAPCLRGPLHGTARGYGTFQFL